MVPSVKRIVILKKSPPKNGGPVPDAVIAVQLNGGSSQGVRRDHAARVSQQNISPMEENVPRVEGQHSGGRVNQELNKRGENTVWKPGPVLGHRRRANGNRSVCGFRPLGRHDDHGRRREQVTRSRGCVEFLPHFPQTSNLVNN